MNSVALNSYEQWHDQLDSEDEYIQAVLVWTNWFPATITWTLTGWKPGSRMALPLPSTASPWRTNTATPRHSGQSWTDCYTISLWSMLSLCWEGRLSIISRLVATMEDWKIDWQGYITVNTACICPAIFQNGTPQGHPVYIRQIFHKESAGYFCLSYLLQFWLFGIYL